MNVDILAFGAHPDDVELGCGGVIALSVAQGKSVAIIDLTKGELGTRGNVELRIKEAEKAAKILNVKKRENLNFKDCFFLNDESHQLLIIEKIRSKKNIFGEKIFLEKSIMEICLMFCMIKNIESQSVKGKIHNDKPFLL